MSTAFTTALIWLVAGNIAGMFPSRRNHWPTAYALIATGMPILVWVWIENGPLLALVYLAGSASVLRWPLFFAWKWAKQVAGLSRDTQG